MWKNYLKVAFYSFKKGKLFSLFNLLGLTLGITCSLLIFLWVQDESAVDTFHQDSEQLHYVYTTQTIDGEVSGGLYTPALLPAEIKKKIPEIALATGIAWSTETTFSVENQTHKLRGNHTGEDFFKIFSYPLLAGDASTVLKKPESIVISRHMAELFFGSPQQALGKTIRYEDRKDLQVTGVFENLPAHSSLQFDCLLTWQAFMDDNWWTQDWGNKGPSTVVKLKKGADPEAVAAKIKDFLLAYDDDQSETFRTELGLFPFAKMYLYSNFENGHPYNGRIDYIRIFSIVALFILVIAGINFMNLTTAASLRRGKEVGLRKVMGAYRASLIKQFLAEAFLMCSLAVLLALGLVQLCLPSFNILTEKQIAIPWAAPYFMLSLFTFLLLMGLFSGSYPAFFLSSLKPVSILKGTLKFGRNALLIRRGLVVFQFTLSLLLIIGTFVVSQQVRFIQSEHLGYNRENLLYIPIEGDLGEKYPLFKEQALAVPGVEQVAKLGQSVTSIDNGTGGVNWDGKDPNSKVQFTHLSVGYDFLETLQLELVAGRTFREDYATDTAAYLVNEAALAIIPYEDPVGKRLAFWGREGKIIGVLKDFHFNSFHHQIEPLVVRLGEAEEGWDGMMAVRIKTEETQKALATLETIATKLNPAFPFTYQFAEEAHQRLYRSESIISKLSRLFAGLAIFIACLGLLGLSIFSIQQRTKEIGVRKVLGASVARIIQLMSSDFVRLTLLAYLLAVPLSWYVMNDWLSDFVYRINLLDHWYIFMYTGVAMFFITLLTIIVQTYKAATLNPATVLKDE
ncbi:MAG: ABC transporter permease [Thermonemataceae bacterium]